MISQDSTKMIEKIVRNFASLKLRSCGIAVSGGSDSMALFHMLTDWESSNKPEIIVHAAAKAGGTNNIDVDAPVCSTASLTVLKTGRFK